MLESHEAVRRSRLVIDDTPMYRPDAEARKLYKVKFSAYVAAIGATESREVAMSALTRFFFRQEVTCRTPAEVIGWWEARRLPYNLAVGGTGLVTLALSYLISWLPPVPVPAPPLLPALAMSAAYGVLANLCYTTGWLAELALRRGSGSELEPVGPALFRYGFAFSIGLTLFPIALLVLYKAARVAWWVFWL
jgi:hypothetical protein